MDFRQIDPKLYVEYLIQNGINPSLFVKATPVNARKAEAGEVIQTYVKNKETGELIPEVEYVAKEGDWVIQNKGGEIYHNSDEEFHRIYGESSEEGIRIPLAKPRTLIQVPEDVCFPDPWDGSSMFYLQAGGMLNIDNMDCIYGINPQEFNETHVAYVPQNTEDESESFGA